MAERARIPHVPALDGVRGAAVAAVLLFHADHLSGGFLGVDLFFTLSGYLITTLLVAEWQGSGGVGLERFWIRRARRLMPALLCVIAAVGLYAVLYAQPTQFDRIREDGLAALFYVANWHEIAAGRGYWEAFGPRSPFEHMWSLAIEEQFYVVWPLLVVGLLKLGRGRLRWLGTFTAVATVASAAAMVLLHHSGGSTTRVYFGSDTRAAAILVGAGLALVISQRGHVRSMRARVVLEVAGWLCLLSLVGAWRFTSLASNRLYEGGFLACGLAATVLIAAIVHPRQGGLSRVLSSPPLRWLGLLSYGLYLWHWPIYVLLDEQRTDLDGWTLTALRLAVSGAVAVVSYHLVEQPIRHGALTRWRGAVAVPVGFAAAATALVVATAGAVSPPNSSLIAGGDDVIGNGPALDDGTTTTTDPDAPTTTLPPGTPAPPNILVVGDSVGFTIAQGFSQIAGVEQITVASEARFGCGIARGDGAVRLAGQEVDETGEGAICHQWPTRWPDALRASGANHALLALGAWDVADRQLDGEWVHPCQAGFDEWWRGEADEALAVLASTGATVDVLNLPYLRSSDYGIDVFGVDGDELDARVDCLNKILVAAADQAGARVIDIADHVCPDGDCPKELDGVELRPDGVHYNDEGGPAIARWILGQLRQADEAALESAPTVAPTTTEPDATPDETVAPATAAAVLPTGRVPTTTEPLRVMTVGDSLMWDAQLGVEAALEATGMVRVELAAIQGMGLAGVYPWRTEWPRLLAENQPEVIVASWGGWDIKELNDLGAEAYRAMLDEAMTTLTADGATVVFIGLPPSQAGWGDAAEPTPRTINQLFAELPDRFPGKITYVLPDPFIAPSGLPVLYLPGLNGQPERVRKADYDHFCPAGAARYGQAMLDLLTAAHLLPPATVDWRVQPWVVDQRYRNPAGACQFEPPPATELGTDETVPPTTIAPPAVPDY